MIAANGLSLAFICLDADTLGGMQRVTHTVAHGLASRGYEVHVVGLHQATHPFRYIRTPAYRHHVIHRSTPGRLMRRAGDRTLKRLLSRLSPGYTIMTSPSVVSRVSDLVPPHLHRIGQYHGSYEHARGSWHLGSIRRHYGHLAQAVFLSDDDARRFADHALLPNTHHIPNPLATWPCNVSPLTTRRVLGVGRLEGVKRFDRLITAFAHAARAVPDPWELHLIGDGTEHDRLAAHAAHHGVSDRVVFRGRVAGDEMAGEYTKASLVAVSSEHEGHPLVLGEAASYGLPSVAFDISGGIRTAVADGGILVPPGDVEGFTTALTSLMLSPAKRRALGHSARLNARHFRLDQVLDEWEQLFTHIAR
ncbi:glycosyltransferase [Sinosporangium siamense]|uniref:Uncharacterized protein n=1 Tax=Sinosporangium siamense TaxID=1367973 RepID=A0A919VA85_9ACTN|nr:glycosyltransferase [Sinosporangium siamense]GII90859.1 hypothetical protein Ssi02_10900 [Sinosporangium siamense]